MKNNVQFDQGIMRLSAYDPLSDQYETRVLTLPQLPSFESLEHLFNEDPIKPLRMTKSCCHKSSTEQLRIRRCQSNPNFTQPTLYPVKPKKGKIIARDCSLFTLFIYLGGGPIRTKRSLFHAFTDFIQKANKKIRPTKKDVWTKETKFDELRLSSDSSISTLQLVQPSISHSSLLLENWWLSSPPISAH
ncbi:hypothetical protein CU098_009897 [Rhizopus stolonifer]|uniref:Uncharacterized protein n=1 Tax=Rhizopus stolonifer TaxID=4846 RepID=A0A367JQY9_RHIST|nr:hypothetical protein CU098_009897 [Rhizopus stolonifer]